MIDLGDIIDAAVMDALGRYTISEYNLKRVASLAAKDAVKNWGPDIANLIEMAIYDEMKRQLGSLHETS